MIARVLTNLLGSKIAREVNRIRSIVSNINQNEGPLRLESSAKLLDLTEG